MQMKKKSVIHLYLYGMLKREVKGGSIHISKIYPVVKWYVRLPKRYQKEVINEMVCLGYLKKDGDVYLLSNKIEHRTLYDSLGDPLW